MMNVQTESALRIFQCLGEVSGICEGHRKRIQSRQDAWVCLVGPGKASTINLPQQLNTARWIVQCSGKIVLCLERDFVVAAVSRLINGKNAFKYRSGLSRPRSCQQCSAHFYEGLAGDVILRAKCLFHFLDQTTKKADGPVTIARE